MSDNFYKWVCIGLMAGMGAYSFYMGWENGKLHYALAEEQLISSMEADTWREASVLTCENTYADKSVCEVCG